MSGNFIFRHHVEPRVKLCSPREESFPIPLKYIDVSRTTHTNLDVKQEKRIDDYWNIDGSRELSSDPWTGFTQFTLLEEKPPDGYMWSGGRLTHPVTKIAENMAKTFSDSDHPIFRASSAFETRELKSKGGWKEVYTLQR